MAQQLLTKDMVGHLPRHETSVKKVRPYDLVALVCLVLTLVIFMYAGYFTREFTVDVTRVHTAYPYQMYTSLDADGKVVVGRTACLSPRIPGELSRVLADKGSLVKKGQLLARLEDTDARLSVEQGEADLRLAQANLDQANILQGEAAATAEHSRGLHANGSLSETDYRASETALRKANTSLTLAQAMVKARETALRRAQLNLEYTAVHAPFDGIVLSCGARQGDMVRPLLSGNDESGSILTLADLNALEVEVKVPGTQMADITAGQPCEIILDLKQKPFRGEVDSVVQKTGREWSGKVVRVGFLDQDPRIMPGANARVAFLIRQISSKENKPLVAVDRSALNLVRGGYSVFKVSGDRAVEKTVRLGRQFKNEVEILEGISLGDMLVADPPDGLKHGSRVIVRKD
jgi:HlyD family secretion protein